MLCLTQSSCPMQALHRFWYFTQCDTFVALTPSVHSVSKSVSYSGVMQMMRQPYFKAYAVNIALSSQHVGFLQTDKLCLLHLPIVPQLYNATVIRETWQQNEKICAPMFYNLNCYTLIFSLQNVVCLHTDQFCRITKWCRSCNNPHWYARQGFTPKS